MKRFASTGLTADFEPMYNKVRTMDSNKQIIAIVAMINQLYNLSKKNYDECITIVVTAICECENVDRESLRTVINVSEDRLRKGLRMSFADTFAEYIKTIVQYIV